MISTPFMPCFNIGDLVQVILPGGVYVGELKQKMEKYNWTDETWCLVSGDSPVRFISLVREKNLKNPNEIYGEGELT